MTFTINTILSQSHKEVHVSSLGEQSSLGNYHKQSPHWLAQKCVSVNWNSWFGCFNYMDIQHIKKIVLLLLWKMRLFQSQNLQERNFSGIRLP